MNKELLQQAFEMCFHYIPGYAYGDNEAACDMASRLSCIEQILQEALTQPAVSTNYLQDADLGNLMRFQETTDDSEGYDIDKPAIKRLAELGVVQSHGFGKYSITAFGGWTLDETFLQSPTLPLITDSDRNESHRATVAQPVQSSRGK